MAVKIPDGFELESTPTPQSTAIPEGFELETPQIAQAAVPPADASVPRIRVTPPPPPGFEIETPEADLFQYEREFGKAVVRGARNLPAGALQGLSAARPADPVLGSAIERIQQGADIDEAVAASVDAPVIPVTERPEYKLGAQLKQVGQEALAPGPGFEGKTWTGAIGEGAGSMLGGMTIGLVPVVGPYLAGLTFGGAGMGEAAETAIRNKASEEQIQTAARAGMIPGMTDVVDLAVPGLGKGLGFIRRTAMGAGTEFVQEGGQQLAQNVIAQQVHKPDQPLGEDVLFSAAVGGILGGGVSAIGATADRAAQARAEQEPREVLSAPSLLAGDKPVFYSNLTRQVQKHIQNVSTPEQILGTLRSKGGVKEEEIEATGLAGWLAKQGPKVKKEDLIAELEERAVVVEETIKGEPGPAFGLVNKQGRFIQSTRYNTIDEALRVATAYEPTFGTLTVQKDPRARTLSPTEHEQYRVPGPAENYRELLLRLPRIPESVEGPKLPRDFTLSERQPNGYYYVYNEEGRPVASNADPDILVREVAEDFGVPGPPSPNFVGAHWREPNVLAHVRFTERETLEGEPVLFIDEIQSDWHQQGRKRGYRSQKPDTTGWTATPDARIDPLVRDMYEQVPFGYANDRADGRGWYDVRDKEGTFIGRGYGKTEQEAIAFVTDTTHEDRLPDAPFKSTTAWSELAFKRMLRWAADNGFSRIAWTNGPAISNVVAPSDLQAMTGNIEFYDRMLPSLARKYAKKLGGNYGQMTLPTSEARQYEIVRDDGRIVAGPMTLVQAEAQTQSMNELPLGNWKYFRREHAGETMHYLDVPLTALTAIQQQGLPLFSQQAGQSRVVIDKKTLPGVKLSGNTQKLTEVIQKLIKDFGVRRTVHIRFYSNVDQLTYGRAGVLENGNFRISLNIARHNSLDELYATATHELGHLLMWDKFYQLSGAEQMAIREAYNRYRQESPDTMSMKQNWIRRDNAVANYYEMQTTDPEVGIIPLYMLSPEKREYWTGFDEWFAEQVAKWATTSPKALSRVDQIFSQLGKALRKLLERAARLFGKDFRAAPEIEEWLDSFITDSQPGIPARIYQELDHESMMRNKRALSEIAPEALAAEEQLETQGIREMLSTAFAGQQMPPQAKATAAIADRFNRFYKYMVDILQLAELNPRFGPLLRYVEKIRSMHVEEQKINDAAMRLLKRWNHLGGKDLALNGLIDDVAKMVYLTPAEVAAGVQRHPTPAELNALIAKNGTDPAGVALFHEVRRLLDGTLILAEQNAIGRAQRIADPIARVNAILKIQNRSRELRTRPYFPFMWFGRHSVSVRDAAGNLVDYRTVERKGLRSAVARQRDLVDALKRQYGPTYTVTPGVISEDASVFRGMPSYMLDQITASGLTLSSTQQELLQESFKFELNPGASFKGNFAHGAHIPGYSMDFQRSFAYYMFHFGKFYARTKYIDGLRQDIYEAKAVPDAKAQEISHRMARHLTDTVIDPKLDWAAGKAFIFVWALGYVPMSAFVNLSQTPMITTPFLAGKFGDAKAIAAVTKAMTDVKNFYKKPNYENATTFVFKALDYGIKTGRISEAMAPELAGIAGGRNLTHRFGGNLFQRGMHIAIEKAGWMFEMAEQFNRRVAYRAALDLAMKNPNARYVQEAVSQYQEEYNSLLTVHNPNEAAAIIAASHAVDQTQFVYAPYARAIFMQGKIPGTLLVFKKYLQSLLSLLFNNKSDFMWRYAIVAAFMGGLMGYPGSDDFRDILKIAAHHLFGKDFDLEREARELMRNLLGEDFPSDVVLHGLARRGFGIPALLNMFGNTVGIGDQIRQSIPGASGNVVPEVDMSRAISPGNILPVELGKMFGPQAQKNPERAMAEQIQKASGALFGLGFNFWKFLADKDLNWSDPKAWERTIPRVATMLSRSYRAFTEERERTRKPPNSAATILKFDPRDPEQMAEILAIAIGGQPTRLSEKWDLIRNTQEVNAYYDIKKSGLLAQLFEARSGGDQKEIDKVLEGIRDFNKELPDWAKGKSLTRETIKKSMEMRARHRASQEAGVPMQKSSRGISEEMKKLFPQRVEERRVRASRPPN